MHRRVTEQNICVPRRDFNKRLLTAMCFNARFLEVLYFPKARKHFWDRSNIILFVFNFNKSVPSFLKTGVRIATKENFTDNSTGWNFLRQKRLKIRSSFIRISVPHYEVWIIKSKIKRGNRSQTVPLIEGHLFGRSHHIRAAHNGSQSRRLKIVTDRWPCLPVFAFTFSRSNFCFLLSRQRSTSGLLQRRSVPLSSRF